MQVAVDGETYIPLRLQVFSKGGTEPTLQVGFDSISFDSIDASRFAFTPPAGATVTTKTIDAAGCASRPPPRKSELKDEARQALDRSELRRAFLSQAQAKDLVPFARAHGERRRRGRSAGPS